MIVIGGTKQCLLLWSLSILYGVNGSQCMIIPTLGPEFDNLPRVHMFTTKLVCHTLIRICIKSVKGQIRLVP